MLLRTMLYFTKNIVNLIYSSLILFLCNNSYFLYFFHFRKLCYQHIGVYEYFIRLMLIYLIILLNKLQNALFSFVWKVSFKIFLATLL